jgi:hypothetical protein
MHTISRADKREDGWGGARRVRALQGTGAGFEYGVLMDDPAGVLLGRGVTRRVRWLTFLPGDPQDQAGLEALVREAARVALMTRSERFARMLDREARQSPSESPDRHSAPEMAGPT